MVSLYYTSVEIFLNSIHGFGPESGEGVAIGGIACSRLSDNGEDGKVKGKRKVGVVGKRKKEGFPPFFYVGAFSIQRTRLSRSLEQAIGGSSLLRRSVFVSSRCITSPDFPSLDGP